MILMNVFNSFRRFLNRFDLFSILTNRTHFSQSSKIDKNQNQVNCQGHDGKMFKLPKDGGTKKDKTQADQTDPQALQKAKKVLRALNEYSNRIDETSNKCHKVEDLFLPTLVGLRTKLQDILKTNLEDNQYLSGALDITWRKGSYEVIHLAKNLRKNPTWTQTQASLIKSHLTQSFGYFQNILNLLDSNLDFQHQNEYGFLCGSLNKRKANAKPAFKILVFLGDLTRYQLEFCDSQNKEQVTRLSKKFYQMSLSVDPRHGQPFNQLAALSGSQCYGLIAVYYYLRCLTSEKKFDGAEGNLKKILEKVVNAPPLQQTEMKEEKLMALSLMKLLNELIYEESTKNLSNLSRQTLENVINALYKDSSSALSSQVSLHGILILLLTKVESNGKKCGMINAFLLAWFTHLITKILSDLTFKLFGPDALLELFEPKTEEKIEVVNELDQNGSKKAKKGHLRRRRRKEDSENDSENDSEYEEDDSDSLEIGDESDSDFDDDDSELIDSDYNNSDDDDSIVIEEESNIISNLHMMRSLQNHPMLESFRLCCLWFMSSKDIIEELGSLENTKILWQRLASLINLTSLNNEKYEKDEELQEIYDQKADQIVFPEDKLSHGMKIFDGFHKNLDFENSIQVSKNHLGLARLRQMENLKLWLADLPQSGLKISPETQELEFAGLVPRQEKEKALMENMAHLWLQEEVKDLERNYDNVSKSFKGFSTYVIVDHLAMIHHMFAVKDIVACKRFTLIVPSTVVQQLDSLKKSDVRARNAIRWLEKQFQAGNRWLRGQKPKETLELLEVSYPSKRDKENWQFFKILECCNHFSSLSSGGVGGGSSSGSKTPSASAVTLITANGQETATNDHLHVANSKGIKIESVEEFVVKCKIPKKGKKRKNDMENG